MRRARRTPTLAHHAGGARFTRDPTTSTDGATAPPSSFPTPGALAADRGARRTLVVGQAGGPTPVINSSLAGIVRARRRPPGSRRMLGLRYGVRGLLRRGLRGPDRTWTPRTLDRLAATPSSALGACRLKLTAPEVAHGLATLRRSRRTPSSISAATTRRTPATAWPRPPREAGDPVRVLAVPKTMDNDLPGTDHCPGYGSVARYVAVSHAGNHPRHARHARNLPGEDHGGERALCRLDRRRRRAGPHGGPDDAAPDLCAGAPVRRWTASWPTCEPCMARDGHAIIVVSENLTRRRRRAARYRQRARCSWIPSATPIIPARPRCSARTDWAALDIRARFDKPGTLQRMSRRAGLAGGPRRGRAGCGAAAVRGRRRRA